MVSNRLISSRHRLTTLTTLTAPLVLIFPPASPLSATKGTTPTPLESPTRAHPLSCASHWFSGVTDVTGAPTDWLVDAINGFYTLLWVSNAATWRPRDVAMAAWRQSLSTHTHTHTHTHSLILTKKVYTPCLDSTWSISVDSIIFHPSFRESFLPSSFVSV